MSSDMKDARWELARCNAEEIGLNFFRLDYDTRQSLLAVAQFQLEDMSVRDVVRLARAWRSHGE